MADDRNDIPGSGSVHPEATGEDAPPPSPQAPSRDEQSPPQAEESSQSWGPVCLIGGILGCGCLIVVLVILGVVGGVGWGIFSDGEQAGEAVPPGVEQPPAPRQGTNRIAEPPATAPGPGREAALQWAEERRPEWEATIRENSEDWQWVRLAMGPPGSGGTTWVEIEWNAPAENYALLDEGPIASDITAPTDVPEIYRPGEEVAKEAALSYVEEPNWVARVDSHSEDWTQATVSVGPPYSEWVYVVTLQWDDEIEAYDSVAIDEVDYPGME